MSEAFDHRILVASLTADERKAFLEQADGPAIDRAVLHFGLIGALAAWIAMGWSGWWLALLPQGILLVFLFTAMHECTHKTAFRTDFMNSAVCWVSGLLLFLPPNWFRYFHLAHHRYTHDPERDPELATAKPRTVPEYLWYLSGIPVWKSSFQALSTNALGGCRDAFVPERGKAKVRREAVMLLGIYAGLVALSIYGQSTLLLWIWLVPILLGQPFLRLFLLAEHAGCPHSTDMLQNTRTTFTAQLIRLLSWNMPYHTEHHVYPAVPFHKLPDFHRRIQASLVNTEPGYAAFHAKFTQALSTSDPGSDAG